MVTISEPEGGSAAKKAMTGHDSGDHQGDWKSFDAYGFPPEAVAKETHKKLSWSRDNEESSDGFSDWKIVVTRDPSSTPSPYYAAEDGRKNAAASVSSTSLKRQETEEEPQTCTYLVHKNIIGVGPRKSEYFDNLFKTQNDLAEHTNSTSEITLEGSAYDAFPSLLNYLYGFELRGMLTKKIVFSSRFAVALRYLAHYFQIRQLFLDTTSFLESQMKELVNLPMYLYEATLYGDARLAGAVTDVVAKALPKIRSEELLILPPRLFTCILDSGKLTKDSAEVSEKVAFYCQNQIYGPDQVVDSAMFASMTDKKKMPLVSFEAAVPLLVYLEDVATDEDEDCDEDKETIELNAESLRWRCAEVISSDWRQLATKAPAGQERGSETGTKKKRSVADLSETSQVKLLEACLSAARSEIVSLEEKHKTTKRQIQRFKPVLTNNTSVQCMRNEGLRGAPHHASSDEYVYAVWDNSAYKVVYTYE